jgi:hypothetical protein
VTHATTVAMASGRSFFRMTLPRFLLDVFMPATEARNPRLRSGKITPRPWLTRCG